MQLPKSTVPLFLLGAFGAAATSWSFAQRSRLPVEVRMQNLESHPAAVKIHVPDSRLPWVANVWMYPDVQKAVDSLNADIERHTWLFEGPNGRCVATSVGPRLLLTSAHCIGNPKATPKPAFTIEHSGAGPMPVECDIVAGYLDACTPAGCPKSLDVGVCRVPIPQKALPRLVDGYESLSMTAAAPTSSSGSTFGFVGCPPPSTPTPVVGFAALSISWPSPPNANVFKVKASVDTFCDGDSGAAVVVGSGKARRIAGAVSNGLKDHALVAGFWEPRVADFLKGHGDLCGVTTASASGNCR